MKNEDDSSSCGRVEARLGALVDGALAPLEEARDRGHLEACAGCRSALARHEQVLAAVRAAGRLEAARAQTEGDAAHVMAAVLARIDEAGFARAPRLVPVRRTGTPARWAAGLAAAAAAVLLLALLESRAGLSVTASAGHVAALERVFEQLPSWSDVVRGLGNLSRSLS